MRGISVDIGLSSHVINLALRKPKNSTMIQETKAPKTLVQPITSAQLLEHWQGHRNLTRRVIEKFPEDQMFSFSIGGMRTFAELLKEMLEIAYPGVKGMATGDWNEFGNIAPEIDIKGADTKAKLLKIWDWTTEQINALWPQISTQRFQEAETAFGVYQGQIYSHLQYFVDNEIHHRGQGYVYLRALGIEPPAFWER